MSKATATAPANIAFVKYWGARVLGRALPLNPSISMTLRSCRSRCTVEFLPGASGDDEVLLQEPSGGTRDPGPEFTGRVLSHLRRLRRWSGLRGRFRVITRNTFPGDAGLASSASGFAALTIAATRALRIELEPERLSVLARLSGSGSAARSVWGGYVRWPAAGDGRRAAAGPIASPDHWELRDVIAIVDAGPKPVSSLEGHRRAGSSPFFATRQANLASRVAEVEAAIRERDLERLGPVVEAEGIELHLIAMSSRPPVFYWRPGTLAVLDAVRRLREDGIAAWATMDAGPNVHVLAPPESEPAVAWALAAVPGVGLVIRDGVGPGPSVDADHLF